VAFLLQQPIELDPFLRHGMPVGQRRRIAEKPLACHAGGARNLIEALSRRIETDAAIRCGQCQGSQRQVVGPPGRAFGHDQAKKERHHQQQSGCQEFSHVSASRHQMDRENRGCPSRLRAGLPHRLRRLKS
jgi:hypothetical protein